MCIFFAHFTKVGLDVNINLEWRMKLLFGGAYWEEAKQTIAS
jgi:hypothetical protein